MSIESVMIPSEWLTGFMVGISLGFHRHWHHAIEGLRAKFSLQGSHDQIALGITIVGACDEQGLALATEDEGVSGKTPASTRPPDL
jgi:hypothetical protein